MGPDKNAEETTYPFSANRHEKTPDREGVGALGEIVALNVDLFFGVKISNQLKAQGYRVALRKDAEAFASEVKDSDAVLGVIDLNAKPDWNRVATLITEVGDRTPILVFGSHLDVDGLRAAKGAGVRRVVSNGEFHKNMVDLVRRYARPEAVK